MIVSEHHILSKAFRALGNPNRLAIFERIHGDGLCCQTDSKGNTVCAIAEDFQLALSTVSHHLKELREANLITCARHGQQVVCTINHDTLEHVLAMLSPKARGGKRAIRTTRDARRLRGKGRSG